MLELLVVASELGNLSASRWAQSHTVTYVASPSLAEVWSQYTKSNISRAIPDRLAVLSKVALVCCTNSFFLLKDGYFVF